MRVKFEYLISMMIFIIATLSLSGAWIDNNPSQLEQPDGTIIDVLLSGDEFHNWAHDEKNFTIIQDPKTGFWCWGRAENGDVVSTGYPVHLHSASELGLQPSENISLERYQEKMENSGIYTDRNETRSPSRGVIQNMTIFIRFSDQPEFQDPLSLYDNMLNPDAPGVNSMYRYFFDASYEQLEVFSTFYPTPNGNVIASFQDEHPRNYYMPYNANSNPIGYTSGQNGNGNSRRRELLRNAIQYAATFVPTDLNIDYDDDGIIDNINFIVRGNSGAWADVLWPHMSNLSDVTPPMLINNKRAGTYNFNMEDRSSTSGVGVFAHEFGHSLGLPDLYRYNNNGVPIGVWDLMSNDRNPPQSISAYFKSERVLRWTPPLRVINVSGTYTLFPNTVDMFDHAYRINSPNTNSEYFVIEYRSRNTGLTDANIPGTGLLVYRVNPNRRGNSNGPPDEIYVYRPGGTLESEGTINNAPFSAEYNRTAINDFTNPSSFLGNGNPGGLNIYNIGFPGETISFYVDIDGPDSDYYSESFESQTFSNFDWVHDEVSPWTIVADPSAPHGSFVAVSGNIDVSQTSRLDISLNHQGGYVQFWFKTSTSPTSGYLRFYRNNVLMREWSGTNSWQFFYLPLDSSSGVNKYSWVYTKYVGSNFGEDKVWIDMIGFPDYAGHVLYPARYLESSSIDRDITLTWTAPYETVVPNPPALLGYNILHGNSIINTELAQNQTYTVHNGGGGNMDFAVIAVYETGNAETSNTTTITLPTASPILASAYPEGRGVTLNWEYPYITANQIGFRITRNGAMLTSQNLAREQRTYHDTTVEENESYSYTIRAVYVNPNGISDHSNAIDVVFVNENDIVIPNPTTSLLGNYPNPFNPDTRIDFYLQKTEFVKIDIYNIKGELVKNLVANDMIAGNHSVIWNGTDTNGNTASSGIYFYKMETEEYQAVRKMILVK